MTGPSGARHAGVGIPNGAGKERSRILPLQLHAIFIALLTLVSACAMDKIVKREVDAPLSKCRASIMERLIQVATPAQANSFPAKTNASGTDNTSGDNQSCSGATIVIRHGVASARLDFVGNALIVEIKDTDDCLVMTGFNPNNAFRSFSDVFEFAGEAVCAHDLVAKGFDLEGTEANEIIVGTNATDRIKVGRGDDVLNGGAGADTYFYNKGDGRDCISDVDNSNIVVFGPDISGV